MNRYRDVKNYSTFDKVYKDKREITDNTQEIKEEEVKVANIIQEYNAEDLRLLFQQNSDKLVGVYVFSDKCQPCKKVFDPALNEFMTNLNNPLFILVKINCTKNMEFCKSLKISAVPTVLFFKEGKIIDIPGKEATHTGSCIKNFQKCLGDVAEYLNM